MATSSPALLARLTRQGAARCCTPFSSPNDHHSWTGQAEAGWHAGACPLSFQLTHNVPGPQPELLCWEQDWVLYSLLWG